MPILGRNPCLQRDLAVVGLMAFLMLAKYIPNTSLSGWVRARAFRK